MSLRSNHRSQLHVPLLIALYALEMSTLLLSLAVPRLGSHPSILSSLTSRAGIVALLALPIFGVSIFIVLACLRRHAAERMEFKLTVALNLFTVFTILATCELSVRLFSVQFQGGSQFMDVSLMPRNWQATAEGRLKAWREVSTKETYLVYDELLGWTVGRSRESADGRYYSSAEGIRSHGHNVLFSNVQASHRIALVGDSFTFGLKNKYEETWGYHLQRTLGPGVQVLNFGVDGYGLDQMYLRYLRDVRSWRPNLVILGLINHDFYRTMAVYNFLSFGWQLPFAKPRVVERGGELKLLNIPLLTPEEIFTSSSISELPFIEYDIGIRLEDWQWRYYHNSALIRYLISRWPIVRRASGETSESALLGLNSRLLNCFLQSTLAEGSELVVLYFPSRRDFVSDAASFGGELNIARRLSNLAGVPFVDLTFCVSRVDSEERFVFDDPHYSPATNVAVATCLADLLSKDAQSQNVKRMAGGWGVPVVGGETNLSERPGARGQGPLRRNGCMAVG